MLYIINSLSDPLTCYIKDDPVRPEIPLEFRVSEHSEILVLIDGDKPTAIVCVAYRDFVPQNCQELTVTPLTPTVAVFYTIWSYASGAGRELIQAARENLSTRKPELTKFVTLSPQTELARRFHLKNGASIFRNNLDSTNYEYA